MNHQSLYLATFPSRISRKRVFPKSRHTGHFGCRFDLRVVSATKSELTLAYAHQAIGLGVSTIGTSKKTILEFTRFRKMPYRKVRRAWSYMIYAPIKDK